MSFSSSYPFRRGAAVVVNAGCGYNKKEGQWEPEGPLVDEFGRLTALLPNRNFKPECARQAYRPRRRKYV